MHRALESSRYDIINGTVKDVILLKHFFKILEKVWLLYDRVPKYFCTEWSGESLVDQI